MTREGVVAAVVAGFLLASIDPSHARRMLSGADIPDQFLFPADPSVKSGSRISKALIPYGQEKISAHCFFLKDDGSVGRVTLMGLTYAAMGHFPAKLFNGAVMPQELQINVGDGRSVPELLVRHALRVSGGDVAKATELVRAAEQYDAKCLREEVAFNRTQIELYKKDSLLIPDAQGIWVLMKTPGKSTAPLMAGRIDILKRLAFWVDTTASEYALAYWLLKDAGKTSTAAVQKQGIPPQPRAERPRLEPPSSAPEPQKARVDAGPEKGTAERPSAIKAVQPDIQALLAQARQFCVVRAVPNCG